MACTECCPTVTVASQNHSPATTPDEHTSAPSTNASTRLPVSPVPAMRSVWLVNRWPGAG
jgi:hypothetical protein